MISDTSEEEGPTLEELVEANAHPFEMAQYTSEKFVPLTAGEPVITIMAETGDIAYIANWGLTLEQQRTIGFLMANSLVLFGYVTTKAIEGDEEAMKILQTFVDFQQAEERGEW